MTDVTAGPFAFSETSPQQEEEKKKKKIVQIAVKDHELIHTAVFLFSFFTATLSHWDLSYGKFGLLSPEKASCDRVALPNLGCMLGVLVFPQFTEL